MLNPFRLKNNNRCNTHSYFVLFSASHSLTLSLKWIIERSKRLWKSVCACVRVCLYIGRLTLRNVGFTVTTPSEESWVQGGLIWVDCGRRKHFWGLADKLDVVVAVVLWRYTSICFLYNNDNTLFSMFQLDYWQEFKYVWQNYLNDL